MTSLRKATWIAYPGFFGGGRGTGRVHLHRTSHRTGHADPHPALWIDLSERQRKLGRCHRRAEFVPAVFERDKPFPQYAHAAAALRLPGSARPCPLPVLSRESTGRALAIFAAVAGAQLMARSRADIGLFDRLIGGYRTAGLLPA